MKWVSIISIFIFAFLPSCNLLDIWENASYSRSSNIEVESTPNLGPASQGVLLSQAISLLSVDNNCELPCFGGLVPGISNVEDVEEFLAQFDFDGSQAQLRRFETGSYGLFLFFESDGLLSIDLSLEEQRLSLTHIGISSPHAWLSQTPYDLPLILDQMGTPDDIFVLFGGPPLGFTLVLVYNDQGMLFRYQADYLNTELVDSGAPLSICFQSDVVNLRQIDVWLQSPNNDTLVEEYQPDLREDREIRPFWNIEQVANVSAEEVTNFFLENTQGCLPTQSFSDLREMGYQF
jgi:hypothetical protein